MLEIDAGWREKLGRFFSSRLLNWDGRPENSKFENGNSSDPNQVAKAAVEFQGTMSDILDQVAAEAASAASGRRQTAEKERRNEANRSHGDQSAHYQ